MSHLSRDGPRFQVVGDIHRANNEFSFADARLDDKPQPRASNQVSMTCTIGRNLDGKSLSTIGDERLMSSHHCQLV